MSAPTIIAGPAVLQFGGNSYYSEGDITLNLQRETFAITTAIAGVVDTKLKAQAIEVSFRPVSALDVIAKYLPYALSQIGSLLFNNTALVIWTKAGVKHTWANAAVSGLPTFDFSAIAPLFDSDMKFTCLGDSTKALTDAAAWNTVAAAALADTTFDETKLKNYRYLAAFGSSPYAAMESEDGFKFSVVMAMQMKTVANWGNVNAILTDLTATVRFIPVGITEAQLWTLMNLQDSGAKLPGDSLSSASTDLVITGGNVTATLYKAGPSNAQTRYGLTALRTGEVEFVARKTWTTGAINPLFAVALS